MPVINSSTVKANRILVTGGAGYIGAITARLLLHEGYDVAVFDNFSNSSPEVVRGWQVFEGDLRNTDAIAHVLDVYKPDAVVHFAAKKSVRDSMQQPGEYYTNNTGGSLNLLHMLHAHNIRKIVFSSSCAVYGQPEALPIREDTPKKPTSVYGHTKLQIEEALQWFAELNLLDVISLRYFNVAGAMEDGSLGDGAPVFIHIIPILMETILKNTTFKLNGDDYPTPDGTCIRDYVHVVDLAKAHILALKKLETFSGFEAYNVGVGRGYSNKEVIDMVKRVTAAPLKIDMGPRRAGDPAELYADAKKITEELGWKPRYGLQEMVEHAWQWHTSNKQINKYANS